MSAALDWEGYSYRDGTHLVPVAFCSHTLTQSEKLGQIEKECLTSVWACEKFAKYLMGLDGFELLSDHKPLVPLMNTRDMDQGPIRCQRLLMRLLHFNARARHVPGKELVIADALSRKPLPYYSSDTSTVEEVAEYVAGVKASWPTSDVMLHKMKVDTAQDKPLQLIATYICTL